MKLANFATTINHPHQQVKVIDEKTRRIRFSGTADELLGFQGCFYCSVQGIEAKGSLLILTVKSN